MQIEQKVEFFLLTCIIEMMEKRGLIDYDITILFFRQQQ